MIASTLTPYPHQHQAVYQRMLPRPLPRFLLADEPGTGKTIIGGLYAREAQRLGIVNRCLVVCPAHLVTKWQADFKRFLGGGLRRIDATTVSQHALRDGLHAGDGFWVVSLELAAMNPAVLDAIHPVLATSGLVTTRRDGTRIYYRLASERVADLWAAVRDVTTAHHEHLHELAAAYLGDRTRLDQIGRDELVERIAVGDVVVIDVRPSAEYAAGHIAGARSIPIDDLAANIKALPAGIDVVAYCRGPYCVFADAAVRLLRGRSRTAQASPNGTRPNYPSKWEGRHEGAPHPARTRVRRRTCP